MTTKKATLMTAKSTSPRSFTSHVNHIPVCLLLQSLLSLKQFLLYLIFKLKFRPRRKIKTCGLKLVMQRFRVVWLEIFHESLVFSHENSSDKWHMLWYTTRERCKTIFYHIVTRFLLIRDSGGVFFPYPHQ